MGYAGDLDKNNVNDEKVDFFLISWRGDGHASAGTGIHVSTFLSLECFLSGLGFFIYTVLNLVHMYTFLIQRKGRASGKTALRANLARAGLALLDAWSDGNATPHGRLLPLGEALAVGLAETWPFLWPFLSHF